MLVVKVPGINGLGKTFGCEKSGEAILAALKDFYSNENGNLLDEGNFNAEEISVDNSDLSTTKNIYLDSFKFFQSQKKIFFIGGDHSVSYYTSRAFFDNSQNSGKESCLIVFDAHPDLMSPMQEPTHEEWLCKLIEDGFSPKNILLIGVRNSWKEEIDFIKKNKIKLVSCDDIALNLEDATDVITEFVQGRELYVSIDIDVCDPAFAPATGYNNEIGGLTSRQLLYILKRINKIRTLRAIDLVEINEKDDKEKFHGITVKLGAKILGEFL